MEAFRASMRGGTTGTTGTTTAARSASQKKVKVVASRFMQGVTKPTTSASAAPAATATTSGSSGTSALSSSQAGGSSHPSSRRGSFQSGATGAESQGVAAKPATPRATPRISSASPSRSLIDSHRDPVASVVGVVATDGRLTREKQEDLFRQYQTLLVQWSFVNAKAVSTFETQQAQALSEIQSVVHALQRMRAELASHALQRDRKAHLQKLDRVLATQTRVHRALLPRLAEFESQYARLSHAVSVSLRRVALREVEAPAQTVQAALGISTRQLRRVKDLLEPQVSGQLSALALAAGGLADALRDEAQELAQLETLVARAARLESDERALRMEDMQRGRIDEMRRRIILTPEQMQAKAIFQY